MPPAMLSTEELGLFQMLQRVQREEPMDAMVLFALQARGLVTRDAELSLTGYGQALLQQFAQQHAESQEERGLAGVESGSDAARKSGT